MTITTRSCTAARMLTTPDRADLPWAAGWEASAACAARHDLPWVTDAADVTGAQAAAMRAVCDACPVVLDCLAAVDALDVTGGWWAGADRDPETLDPTPPAWAVTSPSGPGGSADQDDPPVVLTVWVPVRARRAGPILGEQLALRLA